MVPALLGDIRYALRGFRRRPTFAAVVVLTLAFGIGVNVGVFSLYDGILLRPLPAEEPDRLVNLVAPGPKPGSTSCNAAGDCDAVFSYAMFRDLERADGPFAAIAAHRLVQVNLGFEGEASAAVLALVVLGRRISRHAARRASIPSSRSGRNERTSFDRGYES